MGFQDRDYVRNHPRNYGSTSWSAHPVITTILLGSIGVFILQVLSIRHDDFVTRGLQLDVERIARGEIWRLLTYGFGDDPQSPFGFVFAMLMLWWFGRDVEEIHGSKTFAKFYLGAMLAGSIVGALMAWLSAGGGTLITSDVAMLAILVETVRLFPARQILLFFVVPIRVWWIVAAYGIWVGYTFLSDFGRPQFGVTAGAYAGALVFGFSFGRIRAGQFRRGKSRWAYLKPQRKTTGWRHSLGSLWRRFMPSKPKFRVVHDPADEPLARDDLENRVDQVLAKVAQHGEASLSVEERQILIEAGRRYRQRRTL